MQILWEDPSSLVVNKPAGVLTQAAPKLPSLESELREFIRLRDRHAGSPYLALAHRLDRPVSGAVLGAKNKRAAKRFSAQFATRKVEKIYVAILRGELSESCGQWADTMRKIPDVPLAEMVPSDHPDAQIAKLEYSVIKCDHGLTLVEIRLETGRMHQIRLQAASRGHPVLGDWMYGDPPCFGVPSDEPRQRAIALHAHHLTFRHPQTAAAIRVTAPLPSCWLDIPVVKAVEGTVIK